VDVAAARAGAWPLGVPVHERIQVHSLGRGRRLAYEANDPAVVRELAMSTSLAAKNGYRLDWTGAWEPSSSLLTGAGPRDPRQAEGYCLAYVR
jgi:hypothetical protein